MRSRRLIVLGALAVAVVGLAVLARSSAGGEQPAPQPQDEIRRLAERVERLEARVAELERRQPAAPQVLQVPTLPGGERVPPNWKPREINGLRYYDAPLQGGQPKP